MQQVRLDHLLLIDIETVPAYASFDKLPDPWPSLWEEKVQRVLPPDTSPAQYYEQRAGVMAEFSKIICISTGYFRGGNAGIELRLKSFYGDDEKQLLLDFKATIDQLDHAADRWNFTGHNIKEFDIPFICRRMLINNISLPPYLDLQHKKPWETNLVDTFQYWRFGDYKNYTSLKLLAAALGVPSPKDDIDGSMVAEVYWKEKDLPRIVRYCQKDVITTANVLLRFKGMSLLNPEQVVFVE